MFSHNAYYNELRYQVEKDAGRSLSYASIDMAKAYTYLNIKAEVEIKPIVISVPLIANQIKDPTTNNNWYLYEYEGTAGY